MAETVKRKSRKSSWTSSADDNLSPDGKKLRHDASLSDSEQCESDEVLSILNMAGEVIPKLEQVLEKLENLERYVKAVDEKVSNLQRWIVSRLSKTKQKKRSKNWKTDWILRTRNASLSRRNLTSWNAKLISSGTRNYTWKYTSGGKIFVFSELKKKPILSNYSKL